MLSVCLLLVPLGALYSCCHGTDFHAYVICKDAKVWLSKLPAAGAFAVDTWPYWISDADFVCT